MDRWVDFVETQTNKIKSAQKRLIAWGDQNRNTVNTQEVSIVQLGQEMFDLETSIIQWSENLYEIGNLIGYNVDSLITITQAANLLDSTTN
jgi:hypothetical protein